MCHGPELSCHCEPHRLSGLLAVSGVDTGSTRDAGYERLLPGRCAFSLSVMKLLSIVMRLWSKFRALPASPHFDRIQTSDTCNYIPSLGTRRSRFARI